MHLLAIDVQAQARARAAGLALVAAAALAAAPAMGASGAGDPRALGVEEARLSFCEKADPKDAAQIQEHIRHLTAGATAQAVDALRRDPEYQKAYDAEKQFVALVDGRNVTRTCAVKIKDKD